MPGKKEKKEFDYDVDAIEALEAMVVGDGLQPGSRHPGIVHIQRYLRRYNYLLPTDPLRDGELCAMTVKGLKRLQRSSRIPFREALDAETLSAILQNRCGMRDYSTAFGGRTRWNDLVLRYAFGPSLRPENPPVNPPVPPEVLRGAFRRAFTTWENAGVGLRFSRVSENENPHLLIDWVSARDADENLVGRNIAHGDFPPPDGEPPVEPLPIHLDFEEHKWVVGRVRGAYDIESVALHEIGHCIGLTHTEVRGAVMHKDARTFSTNRSLHDDDVAALRSLYPLQQETVAVRAANRRFVRADGGGGKYRNPERRGHLIADREWIRGWERFTRIDLGIESQTRRARFSLQVHNGHYMSAENAGGGEVVSDRLWIQEWETFWLIPLGEDRFAIQSYNDQFLRINEKGLIVADGNGANDDGAVFEVLRV